MEKTTKKKTQYINNKTLYGNMIHYRNEVLGAKMVDKRPPQVPNYIGEAILLICNNLAKKSNFSGYTYKSDMISDAIIDCVAAVDNFDPEKTNNPFAYFTQIAWNAFIRRIQKEKKQTYIKHKNFENSYLFDELADQWHSANRVKNNEHSNEIIRAYEEKLTTTKKSSKVVGIEKFSEVESV